MPTVASVAMRIRREGEAVTFTRTTVGSPLTASVKAFVRGYDPDELVGDIIQGDREMRVAYGDLAAAGWPDKPVKPDQVTFPGEVYATVQNAELRTLRGAPCFYIIHVRGA